MSTKPPKAKVDRARHPYRMKDLCERTGLDRQTVHFYISQGLVPEGHKTGRNMAYYGPEHVERIRLVREMSQERFLPLKAIKAAIEGQDEAFTPKQRELMREVKTRVSASIRPDPQRRTVSVPALASAHRVDPAEVEHMAELGLLSLVDVDGEAHVLEDDAYLIELWGRLRAAGFTKARGFTTEDLREYEQAIDTIVKFEARLFATRFQDMDPNEAGRMVDRGIVLINEFLARYHATRVRNFLASID